MNPLQPLRIGILRESKKPHDLRTPLIPDDCLALVTAYPGLSIRVQPSPYRCYTNQEYLDAGCTVQEDLSGCHLIMGVKEVALDQLLRNHSYAFFSHTIKAQPYNRDLMRHMIQNQITLHDYELMVNESGQRTVAFGYWAGIVGAWHGLRMWGLRNGTFTWPRALEIGSYQALQQILRHHDTRFDKPDGSPLRVVVCGSGRVGQGAIQVLNDAGMLAVSPRDFLSDQPNIPSTIRGFYTVLHSADLFRTRDGSPFIREAFYTHPQDFESCVRPYLSGADLMINTIYWDPSAPRYFDPPFIRSPEFAIQQIADISCDIEGSVPLTLRSSSIDQPYYGISKTTLQETHPFEINSVDIMAVDNLPCELPADASRDFSRALCRHFLTPLILNAPAGPHLGLLLNKGALNPDFEQLRAYAGFV